MRKFLTAMAAIAMVATPATAEARHKDNRRGDKVENFIGGLIVGVVVGAAVSSAERDRQRREDEYYEPRYRDDNYRHRRVCFEEQIVEYHRGRKYVYYEYRCR